MQTFVVDSFIKVHLEHSQSARFSLSVLQVVAVFPRLSLLLVDHDDVVEGADPEFRVVIAEGSKSAVKSAAELPVIASALL